MVRIKHLNKKKRKNDQPVTLNTSSKQTFLVPYSLIEGVLQLKEKYLTE